MAVKSYGSVGGISKEIKKLYGSVGGVSKEIKKLYASVNGVSKLVYEVPAETIEELVIYTETSSRTKPSPYPMDRDSGYYSVGSLSASFGNYTFDRITIERVNTQTGATTFYEEFGLDDFYTSNGSKLISNSEFVVGDNTGTGLDDASLVKYNSATSSYEGTGIFWYWDGSKLLFKDDGFYTSNTTYRKTTITFYGVNKSV